MIKAIYRPARQQTGCFPLYLSNVRAGFPSPADDYLERHLDLNERLIQHPAATFFVKVTGDSMVQAGICHGDILIVDRSLEAANNAVVVAVLNNEFTVKRLRRRGGKVFLTAENPDYPPIAVVDSDDFQVWGVVLYAIHTVQ